MTKSAYLLSSDNTPALNIVIMKRRLVEVTQSDGRPRLEQNSAPISHPWSVIHSPRIEKFTFTIHHSQFTIKAYSTRFASVNLTGPTKPDGFGDHFEASNRPSALRFSDRLAAMLML